VAEREVETVAERVAAKGVETVVATVEGLEAAPGGARGLAAAERVVGRVEERVAAPVGSRGLAAAERVAVGLERVEAERVAVEKGLEVVEMVAAGSAKVEKAVAMVRVG